MRIGSPLAVAIAIAAGLVGSVHCGGSSGEANPFADAGSTLDASPTPPPGPTDAGPPPPPLLTSATKVDVLFVVDDSSSMADKAGLLADSVGTMLRRLVNPNCVDGGTVVGPSTAGVCATGAPEFTPIGDIHVGVITSSLGTMGGDVCPNTGNFNRHAHLVTSNVASASKGYLAYGAGGITSVDQLVTDAQSLIKGVGETGCGFEAQLEAAYHFLVQPDPWSTITLDPNGLATLGAVDAELLAQRAAFLRPDSLVSVVMITDEQDSAVDPRSVGGQGWAFEASQFPGSPNFRQDGKTTTAPRGTSACKTNPASPSCTSCGFAATCDKAKPECQAIINDAECKKNSGYYGPTEEPLNVRFHHMKERFGLDPQFPIARYVDGFTKDMAPNRDGEHTQVGTTVGPYLANANCRNPLFAASLPTSASDELCNRPRGGRPPEFVTFTLIGGVPSQLLGQSPPSFTAILGADPGAYDYTGIDPHMIESITPRAGLPVPSAVRGDNGTDPVHGREWDTGADDLQFACTFALPQMKTCSACDCARTTIPPLCTANYGEQIRGKAYPTTRELMVAKGLGDRAVVGSVCALDASQAYRSTMTALVDKLGPRIAR